VIVMSDSSLSARVTVVLVRPIFPRNIGMCARALANMGLSRLVLVGPGCELNEEARQGATHAQDVLASAKIYASLEEFLAQAGSGLRIAFSGRPGKIRPPERFDLKLKSLALRENSTLSASTEPIFLFFGPEDDGFTDEDLRYMNHVCCLPTYSDFISMNLSHAVVLATYMLRAHFDAEVPKEELRTRLRETSLRAEPKFEHRGMYFPEDTIERFLETLGFQIDGRRANAARILSRLILESEPSDDELRVLEAIFQQAIRKLKSGRNDEDHGI